MIEKYSADALRFWAAGSKLGDDLPFQEKDLVTGQKTVTKLWNASKFAFMHLEGYNPKKPKAEMNLYDKGVLSKMHRMIKECTESFGNYEYSKTKSDVDKFFWQTVCDMYLEIVKDRLYNPEQRGKEGKESAQFALYNLMLSTVKMFAPIMPYITEEVYQAFFKQHEKAESVHIAKWPSFDKTMADEDAEKAADALHYAVQAARRAKSEKNLSLKEPLKRLTLGAKINQAQFDQIKDDIIGATKAQELFFNQICEKAEADFECEIEL